MLPLVVSRDLGDLNSKLAELAGAELFYRPTRRAPAANLRRPSRYSGVVYFRGGCDR
jgi:hypothetical protein